MSIISLEEPGPGSAASALTRALGSREGLLGDELARAYRSVGVLFHPEDLAPEAIRFFTRVLEAIDGFTAKLIWLRPELSELPAPRLGWPPDVWLEIGSFGDLNAPPHPEGDLARTLVGSGRRGIWFDPFTKLLSTGQFVAQDAFEAAVHELGHLTLPRIGAEAIAREAASIVYGDHNPGNFVSLYARQSFEEFWGEATAAVNTRAWSRPSPLDRERLRRFVAEVSRRADVPLL